LVFNGVIEPKVCVPVAHLNLEQAHRLSIKRLKSELIEKDSMLDVRPGTSIGETLHTIEEEEVKVEDEVSKQAKKKVSFKKEQPYSAPNNQKNEGSGYRFTPTKIVSTNSSKADPNGKM